MPVSRQESDQSLEQRFRGSGGFSFRSKTNFEHGSIAAIDFFGNSEQFDRKEVKVELRRLELPTYIELGKNELAISVGINLRDPDGGSVIMVALRSGQAKIVKFLFENSANPNIKNNWGDTSLFNEIRESNHFHVFTIRPYVVGTRSC